MKQLQYILHNILEYIHYLVFDYFISFTLSCVRTCNDLKTAMTRNSQTDWFIACDSQKLVELQLTSSQLQLARLVTLQDRILKLLHFSSL